MSLQVKRILPIEELLFLFIYFHTIHKGHSFILPTVKTGRPWLGWYFGDNLGISPGVNVYRALMYRGVISVSDALWDITCPFTGSIKVPPIFGIRGPRGTL